MNNRRPASRPRKPPKSVSTANAPDSGLNGADGLHGQRKLPAVVVKNYNLEIRGKYGFIGDEANGSAFRQRLKALRRIVESGQMAPKRSLPTPNAKKKQLRKILHEGEPIAAAVIHSAIEDFAQALAQVIRRYLKLKAWRKVERIVVGGGFSNARVGELSIGRAAILLRSERQKVELVPLDLDPDQAGLIGCAHLLPPWVLKGFDAMLAVDIGGSNVRCGIVRFKLGDKGGLTALKVTKHELWPHRETRPTRDELVARIAGILAGFEKTARKSRMRLAPVIGIGCPGIINTDGSIARGTQNLPGNWQGHRFNLPQALKQLVPKIAGRDTVVVLHNDAVVQGLSCIPRMRDVRHWGVLTVGTGLGNASFRNRQSAE